MKSNLLVRGLLLVLLSALAWSCDEDDKLPDGQAAIKLTQDTNNWIFEVMSQFYYWLDNMGTPIADTSDPEDYFSALLYTPTDRFSVIYPDYQDLINTLSGVSLDPGYEFKLFRESATNDNVYAQVLYVKKESPASAAGLLRGDIITKVNGTQFTINNYRELLGQTEISHKITYLRYNESEDIYIPQGELTLNPVELSEDPNYLDTVYTINNQKIGYVVYNFFAPDPGDKSKSFDLKMDDIFSELKAENVQHLILDLRYNGGGYVSSATNLASLIGSGVTSADIFSKTKYNDFLTANIPDLKDEKTNFLTKSQNIGNSLTGNRVYILTTEGTASSSELIINGLKPYMDVFLIGEVTYGKNVGSIAIEDEENPANKYGLLPIISQSFNSEDKSDYSVGFQPNIVVNEYSELFLPLGDVNEIMLRTAIEQITGQPSSARFKKIERTELANSLERKIRFGQMIEEPIQKF